MLRVVHGNRAEGLLAALLRELPALDPFEPQTIVVGSHLVATWLRREIALARGIATGLELVTYDRFVDRTWSGDEAGRTAQLCGIDREQLAATLACVLADDGVVSRLPAVRAYLAAAPAPGDRAGPRRVQLAERVAHLAWQYAQTRPDWMPALLDGRIPPELDAHAAGSQRAGAHGAGSHSAGSHATGSHATWQAALLRAAFDRLARTGKHHALVPQLPWARRRLELPPPRLARPIAVFGLSFLQRAQLEALTDLAQASDVTVYLLDPCRELWDDVALRRAETTDPLPLVMWGRPVRDTLAALVERSAGDVDDAFIDPTGGSAREQLLADVLDRRTPSQQLAAPGVTVLACPNPRRELEIVADEIRRRLDADPTLRAHEIAIWIAADAERYLAQAPAVLDAVGVPGHLIDAPIDDRGRIGEALLALLELPTSPMRRRDLLRVMTHPAVLAGHPHVDAEDWVAWTEKLGVVHGADGDAHAGTYLENHRGHFHWDQGVRRLALGAFMSEDRDPVRVNDPRYGAILLAPEEVAPDRQASAATYALLVRSLCADAAWLASHSAPLAGWAEIFVGLVDSYLAARSDDAARDLERVRAMLAGLARLDLASDRELGFREAREYAVKLVETSRANRGEPLASGVMVAPLAAHRAVPFRVAFVVGLAEGAFPAADHPTPLDLRQTARAGDVTARDRDRHAFLDVLLGARDALFLSYVAVEERSGSPLGPSSVVLELADALAPYLGATSSKDALARMTERHPLHRFSGERSAVIPTVARERWAAAVRDAIRAHLRAHGHPVPDEEGMLDLLAHPSQAELRAALALVDPPPAPARGAATRQVTIASLRKFIESPIQAWAQTVLDLDEVPDEDPIDQSDEPFVVDRMARAGLMRAVLAAWLREPARGLDAHYDATVAGMQVRGHYPVGVFADAERTRDLTLLRTWSEHLEPGRGATRLAFGRAHSAVAELHPALELELGDGRKVRLVGETEILLGFGRRQSVIAILSEYKNKSPYHLRGAFDHVVLAAAGLAPAGHEHLILHKDGASEPIAHVAWPEEDARSFLAQLCRELLDDSHGYLLPFESLAKALGGEFPKLPRDRTGGLGYGPIDRPDGLAIPRQALGMAQRRLGPLVAHFVGGAGFERDA